MRKATRISLALGTSAALLSMSALPASAADKTTDVDIQVDTGYLSLDVGDYHAPSEDTKLKPGATADFSLPTVTVTDDRAGLEADWDATVAVSNFATRVLSESGVEKDEVIPVEGAQYTPGDITWDDRIAEISKVTPEVTTLTITGADVTVPVASVHEVHGNSSASWTPELSLLVPGTAVAAKYVAKVTHQVL